MEQEKNQDVVINFDEMPVGNWKPTLIGESIYDENGEEILYIVKRIDYKDRQ